MASSKNNDLLASNRSSKAALNAYPSQYKKANIDNKSTLAGSSTKQGMSIRSSSIEDLHHILMNPYQTEVPNPLRPKRRSATIQNTSDTLGKRSHSTSQQTSSQALLQKKSGKQVPFGTTNRRPIGVIPLQAISEYTYLPDVRRINALKTVQMKEERLAEIQIQKQNIKRVVTERSGSHAVIKNQNSYATLDPSQRRRRGSEQYREDDIAGGKNHKSKADFNKSKTIMNRSKSTNEHHIPNHQQKLQSVGSVQYLGEGQTKLMRDSIERDEDASTLMRGGDDTHMSYQQTLSMSYLPLTKTNTPFAPIEEGQQYKNQSHVDSGLTSQNYDSDALIAIDEGVANQNLNSQEFLNSTKQSHGPNLLPTLYRNSHQSQNNNIYQYNNNPDVDDHAKAGKTSASRYSNRNNDVNDYIERERKMVTLFPNESRLLLGQNSVQQFSRVTLHPESTTTAKKRRKSLRKKAKNRLDLQAGNKNHENYTDTNGGSDMMGLVQSRKLAPSETQIEMVAQMSQNTMTIQKQRQQAASENTRALNELATEFFDQIQDGLQLTTPSVHETNSTSLPQIPGMNRKESSFKDLKRDFNSSSKLLLSKRRLQQQYETSQQQQKDLLTVLTAQNKHNPDELSPWETYAINPTVADQFFRSIPLKNLKNTSRAASKDKNVREVGGSVSSVEERIPRKDLQREMTNETSYKRQPQKKRPARREKSVAEKVRVDLNGEYEEIIPRLNKFPMEGKTIQVLGHDDSRIFSHQKRSKSKTESLAQQNNQTQIPNHGSKTISLKQHQSIDAVLLKDPTKKRQQHEILNIKGTKKHYLDDEIKNRRFMKDVGPTSYETIDKRVAVPLNLEPNIAPAIIYRDFKLSADQTPVSSYIGMTMQQRESFDDSDRNNYTPIRQSLEKNQNNQQPAYATIETQTINQIPLLVRNFSINERKTITTDLIPNELNEPAKSNKNVKAIEVDVSKQLVSRNDLKKATISDNPQKLNSGGVQTEVSRSHDSAEFNFGTAYHEVRLPKLGDKMIIEGVQHNMYENVKEEDQDDATEQPSESRNGESTSRRTVATHANKTVFQTKKKQQSDKIKLQRNGTDLNASIREQQQHLGDLRPNKQESLLSNNQTRKKLAANNHNLSQSMKSAITTSNKDIDAVLNSETPKPFEEIQKSQDQPAGEDLSYSDEKRNSQFVVSQQATSAVPQEIFERQEAREDNYSQGSYQNQNKPRRSSRAKSNKMKINQASEIKKQLQKNSTMGQGNRDESKNSTGVVKYRNDTQNLQQKHQINNNKTQLQDLSHISPDLVSLQVSGPIYGLNSSNQTSSRHHHSYEAPIYDNKMLAVASNKHDTKKNELQMSHQQNLQQYGAGVGLKDNRTLGSPGRQDDFEDSLRRPKGVPLLVTQTEQEIHKNQENSNLLITAQNNATDYLYLKSELSLSPQILQESQLQVTTQLGASQLTDSGVNKSYIEMPSMQTFMVQPDNVGAQEIQPDDDFDRQIAPLMKVDPNSAEGMKLIMTAVNNLEHDRLEQDQSLSGRIAHHRRDGNISTIKQMEEQVKALKKEREQKQKIKSVVSGGAVVGREQRFKQNEKERKEQEMRPGPGHYSYVHLKDIQISTSQSRLQQGRKQAGLIQKSKVNSSHNLHQQQPSDQDSITAVNPSHSQANVNRRLSNEKQTNTSADQQPSLVSPFQQNNQKSVSPATRAKVERPSANFMSKVPRKDNTAESQQTFTGSVDFNDQQMNTISQAQNQLTLKTVQKMFAGRKEQHTVNVHKLVRINRLKQLNKADPLINTDNPADAAQGNRYSKDLPIDAVGNHSFDKSSVGEIVWMPEARGLPDGKHPYVSNFPEGENTTETFKHQLNLSSDYGFIVVEPNNQIILDPPKPVPANQSKNQSRGSKVLRTRQNSETSNRIKGPIFKSLEESSPSQRKIENQDSAGITNESIQQSIDDQIHLENKFSIQNLELLDARGSTASLHTLQLHKNSMDSRTQAKASIQMSSAAILNSGIQSGRLSAQDVLLSGRPELSQEQQK